MSFVARFMKDESGATAIEYGLIAAIVGIGIIVGLTNLQNALNSLFNNVESNLD
jgi:Flp pilus assembly protein, pilin Flp